MRFRQGDLEKHVIIVIDNTIIVIAIALYCLQAHSEKKCASIFFALRRRRFLPLFVTGNLEH
jgi:hypothetical protein